MATDNPVMEPADVFYGTAEVKAPEGQAEAEAVTEGSDQETETEDVETTDQPETEEQSEESEELEADGELEASENEEGELVYLDLDGKEVDLNDVRKWRDGHLMQSDYTRKTTEVANERKELQAEREEVTKLKGDLSNIQAELQALVQEDAEVDWQELRDTDPDEYIAKKEKADKRKSAVEKLKGEATQLNVSQDEIVKEQQALFKANPSWLNDKGEPTKELEADKALLDAYWKSAGFSSEDVGGMYKARYIETCLKAAKFDALDKKSKVIKSKVKKATLVTKPKKQARKLKGKSKSAEELFYGS